MATLFIARAYQYAFQTRPNVTLALTGGTFNALGDFVAQLSQSLVSLLRITVLQDSLCRRRGKSTSHLVHMTVRFFFFGFTISMHSIGDRQGPAHSFSHSRSRDGSMEYIPRSSFSA